MTGVINEQTIIAALAGVVVTLAGVIYKQWGKSQGRDDAHIEAFQAQIVKQLQVLASVKLSYERLHRQSKEVCEMLEKRLDKQDAELNRHDKATDAILEVCFAIQEETEIMKNKLFSDDKEEKR